MEFSKIGLVMQLPFNDFMESKKAEFISDLQIVAGLAESEINDVRFWKGCVKFEAKIDSAALANLLDAYQLLKNWRSDKPLPEPLAKLKDFLDEYNITELNGGVAAKVVPSHSRSADDDLNAAVFVHGWRGDKDSFGNMPSYLKKNTGLIPLIYDYPTAATGDAPSVIFVAQHLENWIMRNTKSDRRRLAIIAHSMGGLIVKKTILNQTLRTVRKDRMINLFATLATPHAGAAIAKFSGILSNFRSYQTQELSPNSPVLIDILSHWSNWISDPNNSKIKLQSIYGTSDNVVEIASAIGSDPNPIPILGAGHINICKPEKETDDIVQVIQGLIIENVNSTT